MAILIQFYWRDIIMQKSVVQNTVYITISFLPNYRADWGTVALSKPCANLSFGYDLNLSSMTILMSILYFAWSCLYFGTFPCTAFCWKKSASYTDYIHSKSKRSIFKKWIVAILSLLTSWLPSIIWKRYEHFVFLNDTINSMIIYFCIYFHMCSKDWNVSNDKRTFYFGQVWIHGGSFRHGYGGYEGSNFVAVGDVILVTINYRLTALGFLTTGDDRIKGILYIIHDVPILEKECG